MNILDMLNRSRQNIAMTLLDVASQPSRKLLKDLGKIKGVLSVRCLGCQQDQEPG
jgi:D-3-phosphoglycerate dehydrogenase